MNGLTKEEMELLYSIMLNRDVRQDDFDLLERKLGLILQQGPD